MKNSINNNILIILFILAIIFFTLSYLKSSLAINDDNKDRDFDYIFDPTDYIGSEEKSKNTNDSLNEENNDSKNIINEKRENEPSINTVYNLAEKLDDENSRYNFIATGDWYCNEETKKTITNILARQPELIITTGDQVKESPSAACWIEMSEPIKDKMKIAIGNQDAEFANIYKQIVNYHQLKNPYYSHDFKNIHFISMSTEHPFEEGSKQYEFIKNDLEKTSNNSTIDWIVVHHHKPLYSTSQDKLEAEQLRDTYQQLFQQYDVDLVISSHNQYYERTYPILYNEQYEKNANKKVEPKPIVTNHSINEYSDKDGIIFLTVGTAGDELDPVKEKHRYYVIQDSKFGFLNVNLENNGKTLVGQFHTNTGQIIDHFRLNKT
ncbi:MAG TPA: metallophosphoesterase [Nitrososphaeraceae archaeon]|nr:metallophosphoesterase [Nitrososphaeraceae archaeon]